MRNQHPGPCRYCGHRVDAMRGYVMGKHGHWELSHDDCIPKYEPLAPEVREKCQTAQEYDL